MSGLSGGSLVARVRFEGAAIASVALDLQRPLHVLASLDGRPVDECLRLLSMLFPLCGSAHALAALQAVEDAAALAAAGHAAARITLAQADALAAHVWRACIEWPQLTATPATAARVAQARRLVGRIALALYPDGDWRHVGGGRLAVNAAALGHARAELQALRSQLDMAGALATLHGHMALAMSGSGAEWRECVSESFARTAQATTASFELLEHSLHSMLDSPKIVGCNAGLPFGPGQGRGRVDTARGDLCYQVDIDSGRIVNCAMVAPTDRIFSADGPVAQMLDRLANADDPLRAVRWIIAAWDPCIEVRVEAAAPG